MTGEETRAMGEHLAKLDQCTHFIKETCERQEKALIDIFKSSKEMNAKIASLETVIRMNIAEQKRVNYEVHEDICKIEQNWDDKGSQLDIRMRSTERRIAYCAGGAAVALLIFDLALRWVIVKVL
jgi:hypothetical protein